MNLTREQAIAEHRKMWNWIADEIDKLQYVVNINEYKERYCVAHGFFHVKSWCFLCDYTKYECERCLLKWPGNLWLPCEGDTDNPHNFGLWLKCYKSKDCQEQAALARWIANLPERTGV